MVNAIASSVVDHVLEPRSVQIKDIKIGICCFYSNHTLLRNKSWLAQNGDNMFQWTKWTSSQQNLTCSNHDIAEHCLFVVKQFDILQDILKLLRQEVIFSDVVDFIIVTQRFDYNSLLKRHGNPLMIMARIYTWKKVLRHAKLCVAIVLLLADIYSKFDWNASN